MLDVAVSGPGADCVRLAASDVYVLPQETAPLALSFNPSRSGTFEGAIEFRFAVCVFFFFFFFCVSLSFCLDEADARNIRGGRLASH